jgi:Ca2+-binding RTX toxin-like protein
LTPAEALMKVGTPLDDTLDGGNGDDILYAYHGNDTLQGGFGNDDLRGGQGDDLYLVAPGQGQDRILDEGGGSDQLLFQGGVDPTDLWFSQNNSDLVISRLGSTDSVTVSGWFTPIGPAVHIEEIQAGDGVQVLHASDVNSLISQIAAFSAQVGSDPSAIQPSDLPPEYHMAVNSVWQK